MEKAKKVLLTILVAVLGLTVLLFLIQLVDGLVNGKTYRAIDNALLKYNVKVAANQQLCLRNYYEILNNTQFKVLKDPKVKLDSRFTSPQIYTTTITACKAVVSDIDKVDIPNNIPEEKTALFNKLLKLKKDSALVYVDKLEAIKSCGANNACYTKKENLLGKDPFKAAIVSFNSNLTELKLTKRLTVNYMLTGIFNEQKVKNQLRDIEKSKAQYEKLESQRAEAIKKNNEKQKSAKTKAPAKSK